jgi:hypothetical protein
LKENWLFSFAFKVLDLLTSVPALWRLDVTETVMSGMHEEHPDRTRTLLQRHTYDFEDSRLSVSGSTAFQVGR